MKKIRKLNTLDIKVGNEYALACPFSYEPVGRVKVAAIIDSTTPVFRMDISGNAFACGFSEYYIFNTNREVLIAYLYVRHVYGLQETPKTASPLTIDYLIRTRFNTLHRNYLEFVKLDRQSR